MDSRKERLYKNISETAKLKSDNIKVTEKGEHPEHNEATEIIEEIANNNESINDLKSLERFKKWTKENLVGLSVIAMSITLILTTIILGARKAISSRNLMRQKKRYIRTKKFVKWKTALIANFYIVQNVTCMTVGLLKFNNLLLCCTVSGNPP